MNPTLETTAFGPDTTPFTLADIDRVLAIATGRDPGAAPARGHRRRRAGARPEQALRQRRRRASRRCATPPSSSSAAG